MYLSPPAPAPTDARMIQLGDGPQTVDRFLEELLRFKRDPRELAAVRSRALDIVREAQPNDEPSEIRALFEFVRDEIRYTKDVRGVDTLQSPSKTLELQAGDCDDMALLLSALLEVIGYQTRFVVSSTFPRIPFYNHVYLEVFVPRLGRWIPLESSVPGFPFARAIRSYKPVRRFS